MSLLQRLKEPPAETVNVKFESEAAEVESDHRQLPKQSLDRFIGVLPTLFFSANLQATWESVAVSFQAGLLNGGPTSLVYGTVIAVIGSLALAMSMAEMASMRPTVGAQYRWTSMFAPPRFGSPAFWGLFQGWITVFAWIAVVAQPAFLLGTTIQGLLVFADPTYVYERWHGTLLAWAVFLVPVVMNVFARRLLAPIELIGGFTHIAFFFVWVIALAVLAPKSSSTFVWETTLTGLSGWNNSGVQWCIGLLSAVFPVGGFDGVLHMSDEVKDAARKVPSSMVLGLGINGITALAFMIVLLYCLGDPEAALTTPTGYPIIQVIYGATGSKTVSIVFMCFIIFNGMVAMFSSLASVTRLVWAFARDKGLPFHNFFGQVHPTLRIPLNSLFLVSTCVGLLQIINIGSTTALFAILALSTIALYISYILPVLFILLAKLRGDHIQYGPWRMGRLGVFVNGFGVVYGIFILIWLPFPPLVPVTAVNFNYAGPVMGAVIIFALLDWVVSGRKRFEVPTEPVGEY